MPPSIKRTSPKPWLIIGFSLLLIAPILAHLSNAGLIHLNLSDTTESIVKNISHIGGATLIFIGLILLIIKSKVKS